jgi:hypothetical protein
MKPALYVGALIGSAVALFGQVQPADLDGWDKIKWGMTLSEARTVYKAVIAPEVTSYGTTLTLDPVRIGDISMEARLESNHGSDRIIQAQLSRNARAQDFETLRTSMIEKYGSPISEKEIREGGDRIRTVLWGFPSTSVLLTITEDDYFKSRGPGESRNGVGSITLVYHAINK